MTLENQNGNEVSGDAERKPRGGNVDMVYAALRDDILELRRTPGEVLDEAEIAVRSSLGSISKCCRPILMRKHCFFASRHGWPPNGVGKRRQNG
jgi:hypothetical protein